MSITFTKLLSSITASTVWCEPDRTRIAWICMLAMADRKGCVYASVPGLASIARIPVEDCREALRAFLSPDPDSRTKDHEGRRIIEIDGGWRLLNYEKHRAMVDEESVRESKRKYINTRRVGDRQSVAEVEPLFDRFWRAYPRKVGKDDARKAFAKRNPDEAMLALMLRAIEKQRASKAWTKDEGQFIPHPATWLNQGRWQDGEDGNGDSESTVPWHETRSGVEGKAAELGMPQWCGGVREPWSEYKARVVKKFNQTQGTST